MKSHEFELKVHDLDAGGKGFRFPVRADWLRGVLEDTELNTTGKDGEVDLRASRSGDDIVVHGTLKAELLVPCARCLTDVVVPIDKTLSVLFVPAAALKGSKGDDDEYEFSSDEADTLPYTGEIAVLDDLIRDEVVLEAPMTPLCSESCTGMSRPPDDSVAEEVRGLDPRLAPLLRLKKHNDSIKE